MSENPKQPDGVWVSIPLSYLAVSRYKIALNIKELTTLTNQFSLKYVAGCIPTLIRSYPKELSMQYNVKCQKEDSDPAGHEVRVKFDISQVTKETTLNNLQVKCSCTCPAFLYWGAQWHLHEKDSLEGQARPLLQAPTQQLDKRNGYLICKHVKVVVDRIIPSISKVVKNVVRNITVRENKALEEEDTEAPITVEVKEQEIKQQEDKIRDEGKKLVQEEKKLKDRPSPPAKPLLQLQGPSQEEVNRRRDLLQKEEDRLMDLILKPIEETETVEEMQNPTKPVITKKPDRSGTDFGLQPGQKVRTRKGVI
jgi:hypothetical protein